MHNNIVQSVPKLLDKKESDKHKDDELKKTVPSDFEFISLMKEFLRERGIQCD